MQNRANSDRIVWGTDRPHPDSVTPPGKKPTDVTPLVQIDDGRLLNQLPVLAPDAAIREKVLVTTLWQVCTALHLVYELALTERLDPDPVGRPLSAAVSQPIELCAGRVRAGASETAAPSHREGM